MLFIIQHQVSELWIKQLIHELTAAIRFVQHDQLDPCFKILARAKLIQMQLFDQWAVLETLTPSEYLEFRGVLGNASGFQSFQYRKLEFLLGNKNRDAMRVFEHDPVIHAELKAASKPPVCTMSFSYTLSRRGFSVPPECVERDWSEPHRKNDGLVQVIREIYEHPRKHLGCIRDVREACRRRRVFSALAFSPHEDSREDHWIRPGTGGSSGVGFLRQALELTFFPELLAVRTGLSQR